MTFPYAYHGLKRVHRAELMSLISEVLIFGATVISMFVSVSTDSVKNGDLSAINLIWFGFMTAGSLLMNVSMITELIGLGIAREDEKSFGHAYRYLLLPLIITGIVTFMSPILPELRLEKYAETAQELMHILVMFYIARGVNRLARRLSDEETGLRAKKLLAVTAIAFMVSVALFVASIVLSGETVEHVGSALEAAGLVLGAVAFLMMFMCVHHAVEMLKDAKQEE